MFTGEQAVEWLRQQPDQVELVRACYFDDPLLEAARRFADSEEWQAVQALLPSPPGQALDLGAGRGISSYALAHDGWQVTALEPDPSPLIGSGAIRALIQETRLPIQVVQAFGEQLPFETASFDLVYGRQVLHHACNLSHMCQEMARILRPGGLFLATREHVISRKEDLDDFLANHALNWMTASEHAYLLEEYLQAITGANLQLKAVYGHLESVINYFPMSYQEWRNVCARPLVRKLGRRAALFLTSKWHFLGPWLLKLWARRLSQSSNKAGRLYSFVANKP